MMNRIVAAAVMAMAVVAGEASAADGAALYAQKGCPACHGATGAQSIAPNYPKIAGQNAAYAVQQMQDIKSGARSNGQSALMKPIVAGVSEEEMKAIADWLAAQTGK